MRRKIRILTAQAPIVAVCLLLAAGLAGAQSPVRSFDGDSGPGVALCQAGGTHCGRQPEMNVAASGTEVVQVTWQNVRVYDYSGKLLRSVPLAAFIRNAGLDPMPEGGKGPYEPHVVYDEFIDRWIITASCHSDCLLVSASADPKESWGGVYLSCLDGGPCLATNPGIKISYDRNGIYYCAAHRGDDNPDTVPGVAYDCFAVPTAEVAPIARGVPPTHLNRAHHMPLDVVPAIDNDRNKAASAPAFFVNKSCARTAPNACQRSANFPFRWIVNTFTWNGPTGTYNAGGAQQLIETDIGSAASKWLYNTPCCGANASIPQAGSAVTLRAAGSHRVMNVVQSGSHLYGALGSGPCTTDCGAQGTDANNLMFYVDLDCSKPRACVVSQTAKLSGASFNAEFGTVGVDVRGNVGITASSSTASTHLGLLLWTRRASDPPNLFTGPTTIVDGTQPYTCLGNQDMMMLGSTVGILTTRDPLDGTKLWTTGQWSDDAAPCVWNTRIVQYQIVPVQTKEPQRRAPRSQ